MAMLNSLRATWANHGFPYLLSKLAILVRNHRPFQPTPTLQREPVFYQPAGDSQPFKRVAANRDIALVTINFYDWDGKVLFKGGAERYVYDLAVLLKQQGYAPRIVQKGNHAFERDYRGIPVQGIVCPTTRGREISRIFREAVKTAGLIIASPINLACEMAGLPVIGINHGIFWDTDISFGDIPLIHQESLIDAVRACQTCVCVDTNFINWTRTIDTAAAEKLQYVPNYWDKGQFGPVARDFEAKKLVFVYPRRLYKARGMHITLQAFDHLLSHRSDIQLELVGQAHPAEAKQVEEFLAKHNNGSVTWREFAMEDMAKAYYGAHVAMIPTLWSEGTSLSCLEAMASHCAIIATDVGGLPNLVLPNYNGLLISPTAEALISAVNKLADDRQLTKRLADKALEVSAGFEKTQWDQRWLNIFTKLGVIPQIE